MIQRKRESERDEGLGSGTCRHKERRQDQLLCRRERNIVNPIKTFAFFFVLFRVVELLFEKKKKKIRAPPPHQKSPQLVLEIRTFHLLSSSRWQPCKILNNLKIRVSLYYYLLCFVAFYLDSGANKPKIILLAERVNIQKNNPAYF